MKNFYIIVGIVIGICVAGIANPSFAQTPSTITKTVAIAPKPIQIQGMVTGRKKYSFTVKHGTTEYQVKLADGAPVGLKMNKPWFDWDNEQVVVDAMNFTSGSNPIAATPAKRVAVKLPAKQLFLISRLGDPAKMKETMSADVKRLNFYLVTPEDPGEHLPTAKEPFISGALSVKDKKTQVEIDGQTMPVMLGFRYATMNGFSINHLEPNKTQVFLTGVWSDGESEILATRILFEPVVGPQTVGSNAVGGVQPVAKQ